MPFFSIIIPVYKRKDFLMEALYSCHVQSCKDFEVLIVDDGSPEKIIDQLPADCVDGETIKYFYINNSGAGVARNFGVEQAKGKFIVFLDSDDCLMPYALELYHRCIQNDTINVIVSKRFNTSEINSGMLRSDKHLYNGFQSIAYKDYLAKNEVLEFGASNIIVNKEAFQAIGGFKSRTNQTAHAEDHDLLLRLGTIPGFAMITHPHCILYRVHDFNSVKEYDKVIHGIKELVKSEYQSLYPGGLKRLLPRYSIIGMPTFHWTLRLLKKRSLAQAVSLFLFSLPFSMTYVVSRSFYLLKTKYNFNGKAV